VSLLVVAECRFDEGAEEGVCRLGTAGKFGMKLYSYKPRMLWYFDDFDELCGGVDARDAHAVGFELLAIAVVKLRRANGG